MDHRFDESYPFVYIGHVWRQKSFEKNNRLIGVLIAIAYPFLLLRLDNSLLYFQLPVNCTSGGVYANSCKFTP